MLKGEHLALRGGAGYRSVEEVQQNVTNARHAIPAAFWQDLRAAELLTGSVTLPGG